MDSCPSTDVLEQRLADSLPPADAAAVDRHVQTCRRCQSWLDDRTGHVELHRFAAPAQQLATGPEGGLERLLSRLHEMPPSGTTGDTAPTAAAGLAPPHRPGDLGELGPYRIEAEVGRGGMGIVYRAFDEALQRTVAVKVLRPGQDDPVARARLVREARLAARFRHDHVVAVHAVADPSDGLPYLVMEYVPGPTLKARVRERGALPPAEAATLVAQVADALAAAHAAGLVHRDVKPSNILLDPATGRARLTDFGLARLAADTAGLTRVGAVAGTPEYMSPEQVRGATGLDGRADVYGLGATLYEALTGEPPFRGTPAAVLRQVLDEEPRPPRSLNEAVPRDLETVCLKALAKEPSGRYPTAAEMADDLRRFLKGEPVRARPVGRLGRLGRWGRRNPGVALLSAALAGVFLLGFAGVLAQWRRAEANARAARAKSDEAEENFRLAQDAVRRCASLVSEDRLLNEPGLQPLRKELLQTARDFCEQFVQRQRNNPAARAQLGKALFDLANLTAALESPAQAIGPMREAVALGEDLFREEPDNPVYREALAEAQNGLGDFCERTTRFDEAEAAYTRSLALCEPNGAAPATPKCRLLEGVAHGNLGHLAIVQGRFREGVVFHQKARAVFERLVEENLLRPDSERRLALCDNNLGDAYRALAEKERSIAALRRALEVWDRLTAEHPRRLQYQEDLAGCLTNLGYAYLRAGDAGRAEGPLRRAVDVLMPLGRANPSVVQFQKDVGRAHLSLGTCLDMAGRFTDSEAAYREALRVYERLAQDHPEDPGAAQSVATAQLDLGVLEMDRGGGEAALAWIDKALATLQAQEQGPAGAFASRFAWFIAYLARAGTLLDLGRPVEAEAEWERAMALDKGRSRHYLAFVHAMIEERRTGRDQAAVYREHYAGAVAEYEGNPTNAYPMGCAAFLAAELYAQASKAAAQDDRLSSAERHQRAERYASLALSYLEKDRRMDYFRSGVHWQRLRQDHELDPLRSRPAFQKLLAELGDTR
jgi:tetratricopeptide (TPR) repeat protein